MPREDSLEGHTPCGDCAVLTLAARSLMGFPPMPMQLWQATLLCMAFQSSLPEAFDPVCLIAAWRY